MGGWARFLCSAAVLAVLAVVACSGTSSNLGKYFAGRTLHLNVVTIERAPELRYATVDPEEVVRHWRLVPSSAELELVLVQIKVENHTAINAIVNVDQQAAELRDFIRGSYFPIDLPNRLYQDLRGQPEATVHVSEGQCFDPNRMYVTQGTTVRWTNDDTVVQYLKLDPLDAETQTIDPGESFARAFDEAGILDYECWSQDTDPQPARIEVEAVGGEPPIKEQSLLFINGSFELLKGTGIDGWLVFEAPIDSSVSHFRWLAGDSITVPLAGLRITVDGTVVKIK